MSNSQSFPHLPTDVLKALDQYDTDVADGTLPIVNGFAVLPGNTHPEVWIPKTLHDRYLSHKEFSVEASTPSEHVIKSASYESDAHLAVLFDGPHKTHKWTNHTAFGGNGSDRERRHFPAIDWSLI